MFKWEIASMNEITPLNKNKIEADDAKTTHQQRENYY